MPLRVAAIDFLNPAPLMWNFHHGPTQQHMQARYKLQLTDPANCARQLLAGHADLGLIPIAALTPALAIVPGCTIASLQRVRSIQLIVKAPRPLHEVRTLAADTASRSSLAYAEVLFRHFIGVSPELRPARADVVQMLTECDAALVIGDPALLALEQRTEIEATVGPCTWHDVAELWHEYTALPWVAAVWAVRPAAVATPDARMQLIEDLVASRDAGLAHTEELVAEWTPRIALPAAVIRTYLTDNIHYTLDEPCIHAIQTLRTLAAALGVLPPLPELRFLSI